MVASLDWFDFAALCAEFSWAERRTYRGYIWWARIVFLKVLCSLTMTVMIELNLKYLDKVGITGAGYLHEDCQAGYKLGVDNASSILCCDMHIARSLFVPYAALCPSFRCTSFYNKCKYYISFKPVLMVLHTSSRSPFEHFDTPCLPCFVHTISSSLQ